MKIYNIGDILYIAYLILCLFMNLKDISLTMLDGKKTSLTKLAPEGPVMIVNVASKCGLTPQYNSLEKLFRDYKKFNFTIVGVPCNQFKEQEPGTAEEIYTFCSNTYGVTFPLLEKTFVNGPHRHPLYSEMVNSCDSNGESGDVQWNFEKFLISRDGLVISRFRPRIEPDSPEVIKAIEAELKI